MNATEAIEYQGRLSERMRELDPESLRRSWRALIIDAATRGLAIAELAIALQVVDDRVIDPKPVVRASDAADVAIRAAIEVMPGTTEHDLRGKRDGGTGRTFRTLIAHLTIGHVEADDLAAQFDCATSYIYAMRTRAKALIETDPEFAALVQRATAAMEAMQ